MPQLSPDRTLPTAVTQLRLGSALQNCCAKTVAEAFDKSAAECLYAYDDKALGYTDWTNVVPEFVSKCLRVVNKDGVQVVLLPLDGRIVTGATIVVGGICDCLLLTDKNANFVEFKANVTSTNYETVIQRATEACDQLWHTYDGIVRPRCVAKGIQIENMVGIDFQIVFDKELEITGAQAQLQDLQNEFLEDKKLPLYIGNEKILE